LPQSTDLLIKSLKTERIPDLILAEKKITITKCLEAKTVNEIEKLIGEQDLLKIVSFMITTCIANFNVTTKPSLKQQEIQIYTMTNDFIDKYKSESLEDFALCFKKARQADLGTSYNRIDSETLFGFMKIHLESKAEERERINAMVKYPKNDIITTQGPPKDPEALRHYEEVKKIAKGLKTGNYRSVKNIFPKAELSTHEMFLENLGKRIKMMNEAELEDLFKQASNGNLKDVMKLVNEEKERRGL
jgi:hypothetical protein